MEAVERSEAAKNQAGDGTLGDAALRHAYVRSPLVIAAVSAATFAIYAITVSAAGAPPSVHAAGLVLWVAHVVLLFGHTPGRKLSPTSRRLGELGRGELLERAADAAAGLSAGARDERRAADS
jgi:hypothetical protein